MPGSFGYTDELCRQFFSDRLAEVIEHLRSVHRVQFVKRPHALGTPDSYGNLWYCFACVGRLGQDHRSFRSDKAMWDHLNSLHDCSLDNIERPF